MNKTVKTGLKYNPTKQKNSYLHDIAMNQYCTL